MSANEGRKWFVSGTCSIGTFLLEDEMGGRLLGCIVREGTRLLFGAGATYWPLATYPGPSTKSL